VGPTSPGRGGGGGGGAGGHRTAETAGGRQKPLVEIGMAWVVSGGITIAARDWAIWPSSLKPKIFCAVNSKATKTDEVANNPVNAAKIPLQTAAMDSFPAISFVVGG
jgi:hypothetical protein